MYREQAGKAEEKEPEKLWHVIYLGIYGNTYDDRKIIYTKSFVTQEEMNTWLEANREAANTSCYTVYGHLARVRVQTIHMIKTEPM